VKEEIPMTTREIAIAKLQEIPESLLEEVNSYIDFIIHKHQPVDSQIEQEIAEAWSRWFESVDHLEVNLAEPSRGYMQLLLEKYRQQGLVL
jgi:hypothetical protein